MREDARNIWDFDIHLHVLCIARVTAPKGYAACQTFGVTQAINAEEWEFLFPIHERERVKGDVPLRTKVSETWVTQRAAQRGVRQNSRGTAGFK